MIQPHGGTLVSRIAPPEQRDALRTRAAGLPTIDMNAREASDLLLIAIGAMSPLEGFMRREEYDAVLDGMRLPGGLPWSLPVTLSAARSAVGTLEAPFRAALRTPDGDVVGIIDVDDVYFPDKTREASRALATTDEKHPGVQYLQGTGDAYLGGKVTVFERTKSTEFAAHELDPAETRALFAERRWERVCAFQTRNPIHRAHEYLIKCALETMDGFLIHPAMGETKSDDVPASARMECYLALMQNYFSRDHIALATFPYAMRYAGPREAILHAIIRKNYGCSHFIVGRDHAGVGNYYGTYDAQRIFSDFKDGELGIIPMFFEHSFYCRRCEGMASPKTCPHGAEDRIVLSGTKVREMLTEGSDLPSEFTRHEVAEILHRHYSTPRGR
ncbi:MAG TPA: sulfate adenylyltransferase [Candidatus Krumholzibacteria bacterium]|nr:sulfate adenylyltransferase [Candidatus Krumholzibacteria bacterium]